ncbi:glycosyltransferase involved in cell wall biosynthesis [Nocardioides sp. BE266]|uniref:glycosyltransferase family protein n=1 Tax=Nocardioides sp. BE266 TaxID=2817725 RepID=UPI00285E5ED9|nr:glycosyltransferase [Nocardioides sp. BE266]MDR7252135.1 glycosyltransferase involved in cell wall biosynthesis [Nocardioides sp. BE266]
MTTRVLVFNSTTTRAEPQPYGLEALEPLGYDLVLPPRAPLPRKVRDVVHHRWGFQVDQLGLRASRRADLTLAYLEPNIAYPAMLRHATPRMRRTPLVGIFCWAAEELLTADDVRRRRLRRMLSACDVVGFFSRNQRDVFVSHGVAEDKLAVLPFGIDTSQFPVSAAGEERDIPVLSVGWDRGRDYDTLARAVDGSGIGVTVVAPRERFADLSAPAELDVLGTVPHAEYRALLTRAQVVVVPTHELAYPTGQTVAMEAAAAGCAVVVTRTEAMEDYFTDGVTAAMPPVADAPALRARIEGLLGDPTRRSELVTRSLEHAHQHFDHARLWQALDGELRSRNLAPARGAGR